MAAKTFSQLWNDGLIQADETGGTSASTAQLVIKAGINEFYSEVASIRDWDTLLNSKAFSTVAATMEYTPVVADATTCRIRRILSVSDETNTRYLEEVSKDEFDRLHPYIDPTVVANQGAPLMWFISGYDTNRNLNIKLFEVPDSVINLRTYFYEEPLELSVDNDVPRIPDQYHYGLVYGGLAKWFEQQQDPMANYYRQMMLEYKGKILANEYSASDEMPEFKTQSRNTVVVRGKIGRVYNR